MMGLVIQLARLCLGVLTLITRLLAMLVEHAIALLARRAPPFRGRTGPNTTTPHEPTTPSRRRAFIAPPRRARRSTL